MTAPNPLPTVDGPYLAPTPPPTAPRRSWATRLFGAAGHRRRPIVLLITGLVVGLLIGEASSGSANRAENERLTEWDSALTAQAAALAEREDAVETRQDDLDTRESGIETRLRSVETQEDDLSARRTALAEAEAAITARETDVAAREADVAAAAPQATVADTPAAAVPDTSGSAHYANCSEARAAGAAPIYSGEPGYRAGLDRDGDGIACE